MISTLVELEHIKDFLEQGFYSKSYLAKDKRLNRQVAVKDIIYENLTSESDFEQYFDEALKLSLTEHPRILPVYYVGIDHKNETSEKIPRIVTKFFKNGSLNSYLENIYKQNRTLSLDEIIRYAHDIIQGMIHLHVLDIVHLDLKASNVYIGDDNKMVIGDFGQAKFIKDGIIREPKNIYPAIMPQEVAKKKAVDKTADIFQFGMLLYSMVCYNHYREAIDCTYKINTETLKTIFRDKPDNLAELKAEFNANMKAYSTAIKNSEFPDENSYPFYVPSVIQNIIKRCLSPISGNRYQNFYEIQKDLNSFIFPKGVSNLYQDLSTNEIHFIKDEKPCIIKVEPHAEKFNISSFKNSQKKSKCCESDVSKAKLSKKLFTFATEL